MYSSPITDETPRFMLPPFVCLDPWQVNLKNNEEASTLVTSSTMPTTGPAYQSFQPWLRSKEAIPAANWHISEQLSYLWHPFDKQPCNRWGCSPHRTVLCGDIASVTARSVSISLKGLGTLLLQGSWQYHSLSTRLINKNTDSLTAVSLCEWLSGH